MTDATHGRDLFNVSNVFNVRNLTNATNMTNASDCIDCHNNYDCSGIKCMLPRLPPKLKEMVDNKVLENAKRIIKRIYEGTRVGDNTDYEKHTHLLDTQIYKSTNKLFDLANYRVVFDKDGIDFDFKPTLAFEAFSIDVFDKAREHFMSNTDKFEDSGLRDGLITEEMGYSQMIVDLINDTSDFKSVYDFKRDAKKGVISFKSLHHMNDIELEEYQKYVESISKETNEIRCDPKSPDYLLCVTKKKEIKESEEKLEEEKQNGEKGEEDEEDKEKKETD